MGVSFFTRWPTWLRFFPSGVTPKSQTRSSSREARIRVPLFLSSILVGDFLPKKEPVQVGTILGARWQTHQTPTPALETTGQGRRGRCRGPRWNSRWFRRSKAPLCELRLTQPERPASMWRSRTGGRCWRRSVEGARQKNGRGPDLNLPPPQTKKKERKKRNTDRSGRPWRRKGTHSWVVDLKGNPPNKS